MKSNRKEVACIDLKRLVLTLELPPGHVLDEVALSDQYELSRAPLREVLQRLAGEGYLSIAAGPAGRNSGFMIDVLHDLSSNDYSGDINKGCREVQLNRAGIDYALRLCEQFDADEETITLSGKVNSATTNRGAQHNNAYAQALG